MNADEVAIICETVICLALIVAGTYLGHQFVSRLAAPKQAGATAGRNSTRTTTPAAVTKTAPVPLAPVEDAAS